MSYEPFDRPSSWLGAYTSAYWNDYLNYWELQNPQGLYSESEIAYHQRLDDLGTALRDCVHTLRLNDDALGAIRAFFPTVDLTDSQLARVAQIFATQGVALDALRIQTAFEAADVLLPKAEERAPLLLLRLAQRRLAERAAAFLDRATRLFLWGFDPECIVMCHSVLEAALASRYSDEDMDRLRVRRSGREFTSGDYIAAATRDGVFGSADRGKATRLRRARNDTIHGAPDIACSADASVAMLIDLLDALYPGENHEYSE